MTTCLSLPGFLPFFGFGAFSVTVWEPVNQRTEPDSPVRVATFMFGTPANWSTKRTRWATFPSFADSQRNSVGLARKQRPSPAARTAWAPAASARSQIFRPVRRSTAVARSSSVTTRSLSRQMPAVSGTGEAAGWV